jgi:hypothetical protein
MIVAVSDPLPKGDTGFTLIGSCPKGDTGPNGPATDFYLGSFIDAGRAAPVQVQASASSRPIRLIFTSPRQRGTGSSSRKMRGHSERTPAASVHHGRP